MRIQTIKNLDDLTEENYLLCQAVSSDIFQALMNRYHVETHPEKYTDPQKLIDHWTRHASKLESKFITQFGCHDATFAALYRDKIEKSLVPAPQYSVPVLESEKTPMVARVDKAKRSRREIRSHDGSLVHVIEHFDVPENGYEQTTFRNAELHITMWYDNKGQLEIFDWKDVSDGTGSPKWECTIIHSTIHNIRDGEKIR